MRKAFAAMLAGFSLVICSSAAAATMKPPTVDAAAVERAGAPVNDASQIEDATTWILIAIGVGLLIWGAIAIFDDDDEDAPVSP
jgi:hypothetical protein